MHILLVSVFLVLYAITKIDCDSKYIDLLPEKEKQEFLDKIARRILEEVQIKDDRPRKSSEITDNQLQEQDAFVNKIMEEETELLKRGYNNKEQNNNKTNNIARLLTQEDETKKETLVDLTLRTEKNRSKRESKRGVLTELSQDNDNNTEHSGNESDIDIQVKNFRRKLDNTDTTIHENTEVPTITINNDNIIEETTKTQDEKEGRKSTSQYDDKQETEATTQVNKRDEQYNENMLSTINKLNTEFTKTIENNNGSEIDSTTQDSPQHMTTNGTVLEPGQLEVIQKSYENINYFLSEKIKENKLRMSNITNVEPTKTTDDIENASSSSQLNNLPDVKLNKTKKIQLKDSDVINIEIKPVGNVKDKLSTAHGNGNQQNQNPEEVITTEKMDLLTPVTSSDNLRIRTKTGTSKSDRINKDTQNPKIKNKSVKKQALKIQMTNASAILVNDIVEALRLKLLQKSVKNDDPSNKTRKKKKIMVHNVFEISPDESPFIQKQFKPQQPNTKQPIDVQPNRKTKNIRQVKPVQSEEPYQVPIYEYLPINAFYNPHNVYGPNPYNPNKKEEHNQDDIDNNKNDQEEYIITKTDKGYKFPKFPSFMPKSAKKSEQKQTPLTNDEEPYLAPVYYYSPKNAFYNPKNYYGPNSQDSKENQVTNIYVNNHASHKRGEDDYDEPNRERDLIEWQYYNDFDTRLENKEEATKKKKYQGEPFEVNLPKSVVDFLFKHTDIDLKGNINDNYSEKKKMLRCCKYRNACKKCNYDPKSEEEINSKDEEVTDMPMINTMSKMRHMMLQAKHFMHDKPADTSQLDAYLYDNKTDDKTKTKQRSSVRSSPKFPTKYEDLLKREQLNAPVKYNYLINIEQQHPKKYEDLIQREKLKQKQQDNNFALNYYDDAESNEKHSKNVKDEDYELENMPPVKPKYKINPIQLIYLRHPDKRQHFKDKIKGSLQKPIKYKKPREPYKVFLNNILSKYLQAKKKQHLVLRHSTDYKKLEIEMVKQLAKDLQDDELLDLYFLIEKIEREDRDKKYGRSSDIGDDLGVFVEVLGDMVRENNKALNNYDWLGTTVELRSAVKKLLDMVETVQNDEDIHPSDLELLKYIVFLHSFARDELEQVYSERGLRGFSIPRGKKQRYLKRNAAMVLGTWQISQASGRALSMPDDQLENFQTFLEDLQLALNDLHTALKYIAMVTKYKNQQWFPNLKQIHIDSKKKQLLELILHLCSSKLFEMIEESAKNGLEDSFIDYIEENEKEVYRTKEEFLFVLKLVEEIKSIY